MQIRNCFLAATFILAGVLSPQLARAQNNIPMLPPSGCTSNINGVLTWDNQSALKCSSAVTTNVAGDAINAVNANISDGVTAVRYVIPGIAEPMDASKLNVLNSLADMVPCPANQAMVKTGPASFNCIALSQAGSASPQTVSAPPSCTGGNVLQYDGTNWECVSAVTLVSSGGGGGGVTGGCEVVAGYGADALWGVGCTSSPPPVTGNNTYDNACAWVAANGYSCGPVGLAALGPNYWYCECVHQ